MEGLFGLTGKTAIVTGGGGALCGRIARGYARAGANVVLWGRGRESLAATVGLIEQAGIDGHRVASVVADLTREDDIIRALEESVAAFGAVDILLNGVGGSSVRCPLVETDRDDFSRVLALNLLAGCVLPTKHVARYWIGASVRGCVLNMASMGAYLPLSGGWAYSAAKAAVVNQTMAQARELAPHGIRVNALAPGFFLGKQNRQLLVEQDGALTERGRQVVAHTPMGRLGEPEELVAAAIFLVGHGARFVTGVTLPVDGGFLCQGI